MIHFSILGQPGQDNAVLSTINTSQSIHRILFDCGEAVLEGIPYSDLQAIDHLMFSHLHMDHIAGFDSFFRGVFNRTSRENHIWGPPETARILQHRFQGFWWNHAADLDAEWLVHDVHEDHIETTRFLAHEAFSVAHPEPARPHSGVILEHEAYTVQVIPLSHHGISLGYRVQEKPRTNIDMQKLNEMGLRPGPWMQHLKNPQYQEETLDIAGEPHPTQDLRAALLVEREQGSLAYITDLLIDEVARTKLIPFLKGIETLICESQFHPSDLELALKNHHTTPELAAQLAQDAGAKELVLFHVSQRYRPETWREMLELARQIFRNTRFSEHWPL
ncbi:MBL fold metallo-hydrolase [Deinococcus cellulosilyticus]|uniref:Ribonuclease Z n=1 Tax=Deinococcus cellulosilyticus (strain DSM 18568 / NBRC 106333 / KACC 11606 / 5516J-15) TaxID=1223518 RepID=A0A511MZY3_DEIC1|nr:MBL fold metallo-hydrolase [Deinococcus cellulosilyticus]GEM45841.1 ribonuclease Z [Deinococcus cellulosilyticus NBRC 106333 = KACC 11606]